MEKDLLVICPTRERVEQCRRMIKSFDNTSSDLAKLVFIVDIDDNNLDEYYHLFTYTKHSFLVRKKETLCQSYNLIVNKWYPNFKYYSETNDDFIYHTGNWDRVLTRKLEEEDGGIAYGDDGFGGKALPTTSVISGEFIKALGWIHMPTLEYLYNDVVWKEIGTALKRLFYIPEVKIEHLHPVANKAEKDATFMRTNSKESFERDQVAFREWKKNKMDIDINKIKEMYATKNKPVCK